MHFDDRGTQENQRQHWSIFLINPFASEAVYTRNFFFDRMSDSV